LQTFFPFFFAEKFPKILNKKMEEKNAANGANPSQLSWTSVLEFLIKEYRNGQIKENEQELEKKELIEKNKLLEA
jgi:hypothetical protein